MAVGRRVPSMGRPERRVLDVVQVVYGGTGGQAAVACSIAAGFTSVGLRTGAILHARPKDMVPEDGPWSDLEGVVRVPRHGRVDLLSQRALRAELRARPARVLLTHLTHGAGAVRASVSTGSVHAAVLVEHHSLAQRRWRDDLRSRRMVRAVSAVVVLSDAYAQGYPFADVARRTGRLAVIPNGIDTARFRPVDDRAPAESSAPLRIGMAAGMGPGKDQRTLIRAAAVAREQHPDIELVLMGDGPLRPALESLAAELLPAGAYTFTGQLTEQELAECLRELDVYVHCSDGETQSVAILQAQATGLPVVATRVEGVIGAVEEGVDGMLVPPHDAEALAAAVLRLAADRVLARSLGRAARERAQEQAPDALMIARYLELFAAVDPAGPWDGVRARLDAAR